MHTRTLRTAVRRLAAAALLLLHTPLGAAVAAADAGPLARHPAPAIGGSTDSSGGTDARVIAADLCPFCGYLGAQPTAADPPAALAAQPPPIPATGPVEHSAEPAPAGTQLLPASRAPPGI